MKTHADERIEDLKSRGFDNAGLYDPPGVGGTHVMYVLHHADKPEIYAGLPKDPQISPVVEAWKGVTKYAGLAAMGIAVAAVGFLHHVVAGRQPGVRARMTRRAPKTLAETGREETLMADSAYRRRGRGDAGPSAASRSSSTATRRRARINHWITAASLVLLALSGLALFHPSAVLPDRAVRRRADGRAPSIPGSAWCCSSASSACSSASGAPTLEREDGTWIAQLNDVLKRPRGEAARGRQVQCRPEMVFWAMSILIIDPDLQRPGDLGQYFVDYTTIAQKRVAVLIHSIAAIVIICVWIVHVYAAIWVAGTIRAMTQGSVTGGWAWRHHRKWLRELVTGKGDDEGTGGQRPRNRA